MKMKKRAEYLLRVPVKNPALGIFTKTIIYTKTAFFKSKIVLKLIKEF
ncbi:hypothetical protein [Neobacillus sp. D3-1R]